MQPFNDNLRTIIIVGVLFLAFCLILAIFGGASSPLAANCGPAGVKQVLNAWDNSDATPLTIVCWNGKVYQP